MQELQTITAKEYLTKKGIAFRESGKELIAHCQFSDCDKDSRGKEAHLYFSTETGQYDCKKCGEQGNLITLAKHFGDTLNDISTEPMKLKKNIGKYRKFDPQIVESCHQSLPPHIREYLNDRGITDTLIATYKLGWGKFYGKWWITIPIPDMDGNFTFLKLRKDPEDSANSNKYKFYPTGSEATIYGWDILKNSIEAVVICEGEFDRLVLTGKGVPAISSTAGAKTFKEEWAKEIIRKCQDLYVCYDNDDEGKQGAERVAKMVENGGNQTHITTLPQEVGNGGDITDYLIKLDGKVDDLLDKHSKIFSDYEKASRIIEVDKPQKEVDFEQWRQTIEEYFPDLVFPAEIGLSILAQILIPEITNPFSVVFVDVPSAGKTIAINFFAEIEGLTYATDKFTPASFVSNAANVSKEKLEEIDLLPRLKHKMFLLRDLATLFSKRDDDLNECLGILTRVLDGEGLNADTGVHGKRHYTGDHLFMILAGSTPIPPRVWKMMGNLGSRLFFLNMGTREKSDEELAEQITSIAYKEKERICRKATRNFLYTLWHKYPEGVDWDKNQDEQEYKLIIVRCARLLAKLRGVINVWKDRSQDGETYEFTNPVIERPDRINQLFYNLCRGHALVCGRKQINQEDLKLIVELAIDSAPTTRARLFRKLLERGGTMQTNEVMDALQCSRPTAHKEMETLKILEICTLTDDSGGSVGQPEKTIHLSPDFHWFLTDECNSIRGIPVPPEQNTLAGLV